MKVFFPDGTVIDAAIATYTYLSSIGNRVAFENPPGTVIYSYEAGSALAAYDMVSQVSNALAAGQSTLVLVSFQPSLTFVGASFNTTNISVHGGTFITAQLAASTFGLRQKFTVRVNSTPSTYCSGYRFYNESFIGFFTPPFGQGTVPGALHLFYNDGRGEVDMGAFTPVTP